jgi:glycosyltransferase involved in cell wall biosynthesis
VVIDDGSRHPLSGTMQFHDRVTCLRHIINLGKGAALKTGVRWAMKHGYDVVVFLDADGQHDPHEIPLLLQPISNSAVDIVFGVRKFHEKMPLVSRLGNIVLTKALQVLYRVRVDDTQSGYRAVRLTAFEKINWLSPRYAVETEMIVNTGKHHVPFTQVPITTIYHDKYKGTTIIDGIRIMLNMLAWKIL